MEAAGERPLYNLTKGTDEQDCRRDIGEYRQEVANALGAYRRFYWNRPMSSGSRSTSDGPGARTQRLAHALGMTVAEVEAIEPRNAQAAEPASKSEGKPPDRFAGQDMETLAAQPRAMIMGLSGLWRGCSRLLMTAR